ncbi:MAG: hypothetical protein C0506_01720 [Anaerolinea sp.]|nr:hypothetical protein [Anaerolinea sp.]
MFVPTVRRHGVSLPAGVQPFLLAFAGVAAVVVAWAVFTASPVSNDTAYPAVPVVNAAEVRSVAYISPGDQADRLFVRRIDDEGPGSLVATFPGPFNIHARGLASPLGDSVAVLSVSPSTLPFAKLTVVELPSGATRESSEAFDYLSPIAWSGDGTRFAARRSRPLDDAGRAAITVYEVLAGSAVTREVADFASAFEVAPVGYSMDGERLFIVVVDQAGSALWVERAGRVQRLATLSPGRTRDWSLSPDGARLAFIDILGAGERTYAGRSLVIATGGLVNEVAAGNQLGAAWFPGSHVPQFGGPGGSVQLSDQPPGAAYIIPVQWSPDGSTLVATIYSASSDREGSPLLSIELVTPERRTRLSSEEGAAFLGWVRDLR